MFLATFNDQQKLVYLFLAKKMIMADGILADEEKSMMNTMLNEMQISDQSTSDYSDAELVQILNTSQVQKQTLVELFGLAYSDNEYAKEEQELMEHLAKAFNISEIELSQLENALKRYFRITVELIDLCNN